MQGIRQFFHTLQTKLFFSLGVDRLNEEFRRFALMHEVYILATSITMTFVNTLLMRVSEDPDIALKYNVAHYLCIALSMLLAGKLLHRLVNKTVILIGMALSVSVYVVVLLFIGSLDGVYLLVAAIHGFATGFYWITYSQSLMQYSTDETRDIAMNFIGVFSGLISLVMPLAAGWLIDLLPGFWGYYMLFGACTLLAVWAVWLVFRLPGEAPDHRPTCYLGMLKKVYSEKVWFFVIHMDFFKGIRDGAFGFFLNVLLFSIVKSEALVGSNTFLVGIVSMTASVIAGKITRPGNRLKLMTAAATLLAGATALLFVELNTVTVLLLSAANAFLGVFLVNPTTTTLYQVLDRVPGAKQQKSETFAITECYKDAGRMAGILLIMLMPDGTFYSVISLLALVLTQYITTVFAKITANALKRYPEREEG